MLPYVVAGEPLSTPPSPMWLPPFCVVAAVAPG